MSNEQPHVDEIERVTSSRPGVMSPHAVESLRIGNTLARLRADDPLAVEPEDLAELARWVLGSSWAPLGAYGPKGSREIAEDLVRNGNAKAVLAELSDRAVIALALDEAAASGGAVE